MKIQSNQKRLTVFLLAGTLVLPSFAEDSSPQKSADKPDESQMMAKMMELAKPGRNHKVLENMVGAWTYKVKFWVSSDTNTPPMESVGTTRTKSTMGGRYFISEHKGKMQMPGPDGQLQDTEFNGMAVEGYDNVKKKFVSSWIDN